MKRSATTARRKATAILERLEREYGPREWSPSGPAVDVLVGTILSQNTSAANSTAGFQNLKERFSDWDAVAEASVPAIERAIRVSGLSRIKAPRIRSILRGIRGERGSIDLEFLADLPVEEALERLVAFKGVGPKTALCVLLFSFGKPAFPVDTHVHRVSRRLGLLLEDTPAERAHEELTPLIRPDNRYAMHLLLITHGRTVCRARNPRCSGCTLLSLCQFGKDRRARAS